MGIREPFSVQALEGRLENHLDKSQESVQEISRWLIRNHEHGDAVVKSWLKCLTTTTSPSKKKSLIYLANDLLQNGAKKKAPFTAYFLPRLPVAFASFGICEERLLKSLMHVLMVWENRNVFPAEYVKGLRGALFAEQRKHLEMCIEEERKKGANSTIHDMSYNVEEAGLEEEPEERPKVLKRKKRKRKSSHKKSKRSRHEELGPPPETKVCLDKLETDVLQLCEEAASTDSKTREKLSQLPNEVQDESIMEHIQEHKSLELLYQLVNRATSMVSNYTLRIKDEQKFRQALTKTMKIAHREQTSVFKYQRKELRNNRRIIEVFSTILDKLDDEDWLVSSSVASCHVFPLVVPRLKEFYSLKL